MYQLFVLWDSSALRKSDPFVLSGIDPLTARSFLGQSGIVGHFFLAYEVGERA